MKNRAKQKAEKLDAYERSIFDVLDLKKLKRPSVTTRKKVQDAAKSTLHDLKSARANIRMNEEDLGALRQMAEDAGMPYQTLINHIIHLFVTGQLINTREVKKLVDAGAFDRRKAGNE
jgi:predicted DNA binding CopG/RHH family protein